MDVSEPTLNPTVISIPSDVQGYECVDDGTDIIYYFDNV
jgi:hypothetical protein